MPYKFNPFTGKMDLIGNKATQLHSYVKNDAGVQINKGEAVYVSGADGTNVLVKKASSTIETTSSQTLGLAVSNIAVNGFGYIAEVGIISKINTSAAGAAGDPVYLGSTAGSLIYGEANKPEAPFNLVYIGVVTRKNASNGEIYVNVSNGWELEELHNVKIDNPTDGDVLTYDSTRALWTAEPGGGGASSLATLTDVAFSAVQDKQFLQYNSSISKWENKYQDYTEFVYNSTGAQVGNRYNNWNDMVNAIATVEGVRTIVFEQSETLPAGTYTMENTVWLGNGFPANAGGVTVTLADGFVLTEVPSIRFDNFLKVKSTSANPIMTITGGHNCLTYNNSQVTSTTAEFYKVETGALLIFILFGGCILQNEGYEVINLNAADAIMSLAFLGGGNGMTADAYRGTGIVLLQALDASPQDATTFNWLYNTQANFSGTVSENIATRADYILYDNATSGLTADKVQTAIDELETAKQDALGFTPENVANKDTDGTLAANSDTKYASQKATKTYADTKIAKSQLAAKGDIISATGSSTPSTLTVGTNDYILKADSSTTTGLLWSENYLLPLEYKANDYFLLTRNIGVGNTQGALGSNTANSNGLAKYIPFYIHKSTTIDQLVMTVGTANAGANAVLRLGIYNNSSARPGSVLQDGGTQSINAAGVKTFSFANLTLTPGWYWGVAVFQGLDTAGTNPTLQQTSNGSACPETAVANSNNYLATYITTGVTGALGATPSITISRQINPSYPNIYARIV